MLSLSMVVAPSYGQHGWAPKESPLRAIQLAIGRGQLTQASLLLAELPPPTSRTEADNRGLLQAATTLGKARAQALIDLARSRAESEFGFRALCALAQHLSLDRSIGGSQGRTQPVFPAFGYLRDDIEFDLQIDDDDITRFSKEALPLALLAERYRPSVAPTDDPTSPLRGSLVERFERLLTSTLPLISIRPADRIPVPKPLARQLHARFSATLGGPPILEHDLGPTSEWLPMPNSASGRVFLELESNGLKVARWIDQNPFDAVAQVFDNRVVFAVTKNGAPFDGAEIRFDGRVLHTNASGVASHAPRVRRDFATSAIVTIGAQSMLIQINMRSTPSSSESALVGHVLADHTRIRPGERIQGRILLLRDSPTDAIPVPLSSAPVECELIHGDGQHRVKLDTTSTSPVGIIPFDVTIPSTATAGPVGLEIRTDSKLVETFRIAYVQDGPEIYLNLLTEPALQISGIASEDGDVTLDLLVDGLAHTSVLQVKRAEKFSLDFSNVPSETELIEATATLVTSQGTKASDKIAIRTPFLRAKGSRPSEPSAGVAILPPIPESSTLEDLVAAPFSASPRRVEGTVSFLPRAPVLVSISRSQHVLSTLVTTNGDGRGTFTFLVGPEFGNAVECVATGASPATAASHAMTLPVRGQRIALSRSPSRDGSFTLTPHFLGVDGHKLEATFSAVVKEGIGSLASESLTDAIPPRPSPVHTFGTDRIVPSIAVIGDMLRDGDLWRSSLMSRVLGYDPSSNNPARSTFRSLPIRGHSKSPPLRAAHLRRTLAFQGNWTTGAVLPFLEVPSQTSWTAYISAVDATGASAEAAVTYSSEGKNQPIVVDFKTTLDQALTRALARLTNEDPTEFTKSLPGFPGIIPPEKISTVRDALLAKLAIPTPAGSWLPPERVALAGLTPVFLDTRVLSELDRVGILQRLTAFPDPEHPATKTWSVEASSDMTPICRAVRTSLLIAQLTRGDESVLPDLTAAISDRARDLPHRLITELERVLVPNLWRGALVNATRVDSIRTENAAWAERCGAWLDLFRAVSLRIQDGDATFRGIGCSIIDVEGTMPGASLSAVSTRLREIASTTASAILDGVKHLSLDDPTESEQLQRLPLRTLVEALPPHERMARALAVISSWLRQRPRPPRWVESAIGDLLEPLPRYGRLYDVTSRSLLREVVWPDQLTEDYAALMSDTLSEQAALELAQHAPPWVWKRCTVQTLVRPECLTSFSACVELWRRDDSMDAIRDAARKEDWTSVWLPARLHAQSVKDPSSIFDGLPVDLLIACARDDVGQPEHQGFNLLVHALAEIARDDPAPLITALLDPKVKAGRLAISTALGSLRYSAIAWPSELADWEEAHWVLKLRADPNKLPSFRGWYASTSKPVPWFLSEMGASITMQDWIKTIQRHEALGRRSPPVGYQGNALLLGCDLSDVLNVWDQIPDPWCQTTADLLDKPVRQALSQATRTARGERQIRDDAQQGSRWSAAREAAAVMRCLDLMERGADLPNSEWAQDAVELWLLRTGLGLR